MTEPITEDHRTVTPAAGAFCIGSIDLVFAALALVSALPVLLVRYPESVDYLNHLARLFVLTAPAGDPVHAVYLVHWQLIPNLGLELLGVPLATLFPLEAVMKIIWASCVLGMAAALWFLHRSLHARTQPTLLLGAICLINLPLTIGLLSFDLGLALALATTGLWFRLGDRATMRSLLILNLASALIVVTHIAACASLALTLGALHVLRRPFGATAMLRRAVTIASGFVLPALLMLVIVLSRTHMPDAAASSSVAYVWRWKLQLALAPAFTGISLSDAIGALSLWVTLLLALRAGGSCHQRLIFPLLLWLATLLALPFSIGAATIIDLREAVFPALLLVAAIGFAPTARAWSCAVVAIAIAGVVARTALLMPEWRRHDADVASFRALGDQVARGAKVLVAAAPDRQGTCAEHRFAPFDEHIPVLLTIDRAAFVSTVFAKPDLQPIEPAAALGEIAIPDLGIVPWSILDSAPNTAAQAAADPWRIYRGEWRKYYDYLALRRLNCPAEIPPEPDLVPVADSATYRLYRIVHRTE